MIDLLEGKELKFTSTEQKDSFVQIVDTMPRVLPEGVVTGDYAVCQAARVSYGAGTKSVSEDATLIRYLLRHWHTTPFEMIEVKWHMSMPIATARQWIRHRTASVNEYSARYSVVKDIYYIPVTDNIRQQSKTNKQGSEQSIEVGDAEWFAKTLEDADAQAYKNYEEALARGVSREQARYFLPVNYHTFWYWKMDLWNTMNFLRLRMDHHAQREIRVLADGMHQLMVPLFPVCMKAFDDYVDMNRTVKLSAPEVERIRSRSPEPFPNKREEEEFQHKLKKLHLEEILLGGGQP